MYEEWGCRRESELIRTHCSTCPPSTSRSSSASAPPRSRAGIDYAGSTSMPPLTWPSPPRRRQVPGAVAGDGGQYADGHVEDSFPAPSSTSPAATAGYYGYMWAKSSPSIYQRLRPRHHELHLGRRFREMILSRAAKSRTGSGGAVLERPVSSERFFGKSRW